MLEGEADYSRLTEYANQRMQELTDLFSPVLSLLDKYGALICEVTSVLGDVAPTSTQERVLRDLMADVFDFLWEWRRPLLEGRVQVGYPLGRRAYESLSLMAICAQDVSFAEKWESGKQIKNATIREALARAPMAETEDTLRDLYKFFSLAAHPNRELVSYRYLGEGNRFVLGSIGMPSLALMCDHFIKMVQMWFWFGALVSYFFREEVGKKDPDYGKSYLAVTAEAKQVIAWLGENFSRLLSEEVERAKGDSPQHA